MSNKEKADWTVIVYLAGDNNLTEEMVLALKEINAVEIKDKLRVVALLDPSGMGIPSKIYDLNGNSTFDNLKSVEVSGDELKFVDATGNEEPYEIRDTNTGNPNALRSFIVWGARRYPAKRYAVILSGHGSGSDEDFLLKDQAPLDSLTIPELQNAIDNACRDLNIEQIDILGMDSCLMSMAEVCYELRDRVRILIGSEGFAPEAGWPYHRILQEILGNFNRYLVKTDNEPELIARMIVKKYASYYEDYESAAGISVDLAAVDLTSIAKVADGIKALVRELHEGVSSQKLESRRIVNEIVLAHWHAQTYKFDQYVDLRDFCETLRDQFARLGNGYKDMTKACDGVVAAVKDAVIASCCVGPAFQYSYGLSVYFPWAELSDEYQKNLRFADYTGWFRFLDNHVENETTGSRRPSRYANNTRHLEIDKKRCHELTQAFAKQHRRVRSKRVGSGYQMINAEHRYDKSRYDKSRYDKSRYPNDRSRSTKNPPTSSGRDCYFRDKSEEATSEA